jgi:Coenzyme PQQ synthesis protein D (PqqD)
MSTQADEARLEIPAHVIWRDVPGELVLFDQRGGEYHTLNGIGATVWRAVSRGDPVPDVVAALATRYTAAPDVIARDVGEFIAVSIRKGLLVAAEPRTFAGAPVAARP